MDIIDLKTFLRKNTNPDYVFMLFLVNVRKLMNNDDIPIMSDRRRRRRRERREKKEMYDLLGDVEKEYLFCYI